MQKTNEKKKEDQMMDETEKEQVSTALTALTRQVLDVNTENNRLRAENKHILRMGVVSLEVLPIGGMDCKELFNEFSQFAEKLHKMHGNEHLKFVHQESESMIQDAEGVPEMFG